MARPELTGRKVSERHGEGGGGISDGALYVLGGRHRHRQPPEPTEKERERD